MEKFTKEIIEAARAVAKGQNWYRNYRDWDAASNRLIMALVAYDAAQPKPDPLCKIDVGSRPYWMGVDQYDACPCLLPKDHKGVHKCKHLTTTPIKPPGY